MGATNVTNNPTVANPHEHARRIDKVQRIASVVIRSAAGDVEQMRQCADLIASTTDNGTRFARSLWSELGEDWHAGDWRTRALVADRIMEHVKLVVKIASERRAEWLAKGGRP